jgi:HK97 family phage major capsid protein
VRASRSPRRKVAHYAEVQDEILNDWTQFRQVVTTEMLAGLIDAENEQLLNRSGVAPDLVGLVATPAIQTTGSAGTDLDAIATAMNIVRTAVFMEPDTIVMHPNDWSSTGFQLAKDSTGQYFVGNPLQATTPTLWGVPVVLTTRQTENTVVVANLKQAARAYLRETPRVDVAPYGGGFDQFTKNTTLIRAEERLALTVVRPQAIVTVTAV